MIDTAVQHYLMSLLATLCIKTRYITDLFSNASWLMWPMLLVRAAVEDSTL